MRLLNLLQFLSTQFEFESNFNVFVHYKHKDELGSNFKQETSIL